MDAPGEMLHLYFFAHQQAWGGHTYETYRHTLGFPTRSGITGLLGAAFGIDRGDISSLTELDGSYTCAVKIDAVRSMIYRGGAVRPLTPGFRAIDYQTVKNPRRNYNQGDLSETEQTWREYLIDNAFTVLLKSTGTSERFSLENMAQAVEDPYYALYFGRKNCIPADRIYRGFLAGDTFHKAFLEMDIVGGETVVSEEEPDGVPSITQVVRDVLYGERMFGTRKVFIYSMPPVKAAGEPLDISHSALL